MRLNGERAYIDQRLLWADDVPTLLSRQFSFGGTRAQEAECDAPASEHGAHDVGDRTAPLHDAEH
jgi:hypothetical protein